MQDLCYELGYKMDPVEVQAALRSLDTDNSGTVGFDEFYKWFTSNDKFKALDISSNPKLLQAAEYFRSVPLPPHSRETNSLSSKYDTDYTGKIGLSEYKLLAADLGQIGLSDRDYAAGLISLDKNKDGQIDFNEFMNWLKWDK